MQQKWRPDGQGNITHGVRIRAIFKGWLWDTIIRDQYLDNNAKNTVRAKPTKVTLENFFVGEDRVRGVSYAEPSFKFGHYSRAITGAFSSLKKLFIPKQLFGKQNQQYRLWDDNRTVFQRNNQRFNKTFFMSREHAILEVKTGLEYVLSAPFRILGWMLSIFMIACRIEWNLLRGIFGYSQRPFENILEKGITKKNIFYTADDYEPVLYLIEGGVSASNKPGVRKKFFYFLWALGMIPAALIALAVTLVLATLYYGLRALVALPLFLFAAAELVIASVAWIFKALNHFAASLVKSKLFWLEFGLGLVVAVAAFGILTLALGALGVPAFASMAAWVMATVALSFFSPAVLITLAVVAGFVVSFMIGLLLTNNNPVRFGFIAFLQSMFLGRDDKSECIFTGKINEVLAYENASETQRVEYTLIDLKLINSDDGKSGYEFGSYVKDTGMVIVKAAFWPVVAPVQAGKAAWDAYKGKSEGLPNFNSYITDDYGD